MGAVGPARIRRNAVDTARLTARPTPAADKLWAYPWLIALLVAFIGYQLYQITAVRFSAGLTALTVFDIALAWLTWREYQSKRAPRHHGARTSRAV